MLSRDFLTVDTVWLRRLYVLVSLSIGGRRVEYVACTSNPDTAWMLQQAHNLLMDLDDRGRQMRFLLHDRDSKFSAACDGLFASEGIRIVRTPVRAPNANAHVERWVGTVRRECLDRLLILGRRQLERILGVYVRHYNQSRPHRALDLRPPEPTATVAAARGDPPAPLTGVQQAGNSCSLRLSAVTPSPVPRRPPVAIGRPSRRRWRAASSR
jgi:transposase InsO family protein